jgi:hypothetical protein
MCGVSPPASCRNGPRSSRRRSRLKKNAPQAIAAALLRRPFSKLFRHSSRICFDFCLFVIYSAVVAAGTGLDVLSNATTVT